MENKQQNGLVHVKSKEQVVKPRCNTAVIPEHLRSSNLPDPLKHLTHKKGGTAHKSAVGSNDSGRLKDELAKLKEQREQTALRLKAMKAKAKTGAVRPPPPPPML